MSDKKTPDYSGSVSIDGVKNSIALWAGNAEKTVFKGTVSTYDHESEVNTRTAGITLFPKGADASDKAPAFAGFLNDGGIKQEDGTYSEEVRRSENVAAFVKGKRFDIVLSVKGDNDKFINVGKGELFDESIKPAAAPAAPAAPAASDASASASAPADADADPFASSPGR